MPRRILVIDDSPLVLDISKDLLTESGYEVEVAATGEEGVEKSSSFKPDIVLIDTLLPGIDGFEVCKKIKELGLSPSPKLIVMTGSIDAIDAVKAKKSGADDYCVKTEDCSHIVDTVKKISG